MNPTTLLIFLSVAIALTLNANADYWWSSVDTNSSHWSIYRQSQNLSFHMSGSVEGSVSPVDINGRTISPHLSYYVDVGSNDVRLRQRTSALEGNYKSAEEMMLESRSYPEEIEITVDKPAGTDIYTIEYKNEIWPVFASASRTLDYSGKQINDRDFEGNNGDFVGANFLYNRELTKEQRSIIWLQRMNATVLATDEAILLAEFKPTKYLGYLMQAKTNGIADLSYRQRDYRYDVRHQMYPAVSEGDERYYGEYNLARKIEMRSTFEDYDDDDEWLPCCYSGWNDMGLAYQNLFGINARDVFNCTCPKLPTS